MDRCYICIFHASWKGRAWQRIIKIMIQEMRYDIYIFLDNFIVISVFCEAFLVFNLLSSFTISSCEILVELKGFKEKQKLKFNRFYCQHLNFIDNWISFKWGNVPVNQGSFFSSLSQSVLNLLLFTVKKDLQDLQIKDVDSAFHY